MQRREYKLVNWYIYCDCSHVKGMRKHGDNVEGRLIKNEITVVFPHHSKPKGGEYSSYEAEFKPVQRLLGSCHQSNTQSRRGPPHHWIQITQYKATMDFSLLLPIWSMHMAFVGTSCTPTGQTQKPAHTHTHTQTPPDLTASSDECAARKPPLQGGV